MSKQILPPTAAAIRPEYFPADFFLNRKISIIFLVVFLFLGFGLRVRHLGAESLSEDELNKLQTVAEYREKGLTGRNGEHPFLMKGLQTISISVAEKLNDSVFAASHESQISDEFALRFPTALFGSFTALLIFLLLNEFFGSSIALIAAALWAVDPSAIGFDRIAKEDSFLLFFFLLANTIWVFGQTASERGKSFTKHLVFTAVFFGAMLASKYLVHILFIGLAYFAIIRSVPATKWEIGKTRWLVFYAVIGISFIIFNPTILLPDTWREMLTFSSEKRIGHDSYEFANQLYQNKMTLWLKGVPWYFYYFFILYKTPILTLIFAVIGFPFLFFRKLGDGRVFLLLWIALWFIPFTFLGGKFARYYTIAEPTVLILAAIGCFLTASVLAKKLFPDKEVSRKAFMWILPAIMISASIFSAFSIAPHFRLYTNEFAGNAQDRFYFPHDEFYDASTEEIVLKIIRNARENAVVAVETPILFEYYAQKWGRGDIHFVSLSDELETVKLAAGDFIVVARGRRYFSNDAFLKYLENNVQPYGETELGEDVSAKIYLLDDDSATQIRNITGTK